MHLLNGYGHNTKSTEAARSDERTLFVARVFLGVCLSILIHVVVSVVTYELSEGYGPESRLRKPALMEWIEPSELEKDFWKKNDNIVVRKVDLPKDLIDLSVKPVRRFNSEDKQTVKQEMQAPNKDGMTENRMDTSLSKTRPASQLSLQTAQESSRERFDEMPDDSVLPHGLGDIAWELKKRKPRGNGDSANATELLLPSDPRRNRGISTTGEVLPPDVQIGEFTALNTDRFVYYSFFARTEERIRNPWVRHVRAAFFGGGDIPEGTSPLVTKVEFVLDREGRFIRGILLESSGSKDVDRAALLAFHEAKQIPHPPREMVKDDGTIRLFYAFQVDRILAMPVARAKTKPPVRAAGGSADNADAKTE